MREGRTLVEKLQGQKGGGKRVEPATANRKSCERAKPPPINPGNTLYDFKLYIIKFKDDTESIYKYGIQVEKLMSAITQMILPP